ncbi:4'-phosphopantetheinyl transferase [Russula ochroleuca]|uniref:4'-phosphopantetheinyl transferase n=1 Tax=Russula ochroleuca TaxID=152965 RepID=A0A9P5TCR7_9AGAM|nr:4'-phosphopantetheinyl transferase [Russula ochroleuca]
MTILGIGVDVLHLPRLIRHLSDNRLARRILTFQSNCRWAVKEAVYKAVYPALRPTWQDFTLRKCTGSPKPDLVYHPKDNLLSLRLGRIHTSASHDRDYVFATVVVEQPASI